MRPDAWVMSLDEQIAAEANRRAKAELRQRFRSEKNVPDGSGIRGRARPSADDIIAAYKKARREQGDDDDPHDDDKPKDDEPELRGPPQTQTVATPRRSSRREESGGPVTEISIQLPATGFIEPTRAELRSLSKIVAAAHPGWTVPDEDEFRRAFVAQGFFFRLPGPNTRVYYGSHLDAANEFLGRLRWPAIGGGAFMFAIVAAADVPIRFAALRSGSFKRSASINIAACHAAISGVAFSTAPRT